jgi:hypothetical protein
MDLCTQASKHQRPILSTKSRTIMKRSTLPDAEVIGATMTRSDCPIAFLTIVLALTGIFLPAPSTSLALAAGAPSFCVTRGGSNGPGSEPQDCAYFDYQACLQAAADMHGNCVVNIDYHGEVSTMSTPARALHALA